jgi:hypothetical protein
VRLPDGLHDPLRDEQILSATLADLESPAAGEPMRVTAKGLEAVLDSVLHTDSVDQTIDDRDWIKAVLATEEQYVAVTNKGQYVALMSRTAVTNAILAGLAASTIVS